MSEHEVAIIGGGVVGVSTAYYLYRQGISSTVFDPCGIATKASGLAYGGLVSVSGFEVPGKMWELGEYSLNLHRSLRESLLLENGIDCLYRDRNTMNIAFTRQEMTDLQTRVNWINSATQLSAEVLSPTETLQREPRINSDILGASVLQQSLDVDASNLSQALAKAANCSIERRNVSHLSVKQDGIQLHFDNAESTTAQTVVCANGAWVDSLLASVRLQVPVEPLKGQILRLEIDGDPVRFSIGWDGNYCTTKSDGLLWAGTTEERDGYDESTNERARQVILDNLKRVLPGVSVKRVARQTACLRPVTSDGLPLLGQVPNQPRLLVATGAGRKGILYGPGMGKTIADMICGKDPDIDVNPFAIDRLATSLS